MDKKSDSKRVKELEDLVVELLNALTRLGSQTGNGGWAIIREAEDKAKKKGFGRIMQPTPKWKVS